VAPALRAAGVDGVNVEGEGAHGPILTGLAGRWEDTLKALETLRGGDARGALEHSDVGPIDVVWRAGDRGLEWIERAHPEVVADLPDRLAAMKVVSRTENRVRLASDDAKAVVRLDWDGEAKTWLMTAYEVGRRGDETTASAPDLPDQAGKSPGGPAGPNMGGETPGVNEGRPEGTEPAPTGDEVIAADPELTKLDTDTSNAAGALGQTAEVAAKDEPNTIAEAIAAAAQCLMESAEEWMT
jgi:hypothetical protein